MNFLNFLTSGAGIFNFNLQNLSLNNNLNKSLIPPHQLPKMIQNQSEQHISQLLPNPQPESNPILERMLTTSQNELLSHQQQLINQYMHLNLQLLSKKIETLESQPQKKQENSVSQVKSNKKKMYFFVQISKKQNINCGHNDREHYAKGMCNNCYHKNGRTKKPWKCEHQKLYANGLCQNCYINKYNKMKREKNSSNQRINFEGYESKQFNSEPKIEESS